MNALDSRALARAAAFGAMAIVWGLTWIAAKWSLEAAPPVFLAATRLLLACPIFLAWSLFAGHPLATGRIGRLLAASLLLNTGCYSLLFWGVTRTPSGLAAIVNLSLVPVFSMLVGALYGEERITVRRLFAVALGGTGLALLFATRAPDAPGQHEAIALGLLAVVAGTLSYAWGAIVSKPLVRSMAPVAVAFWETLIGGVSLLALSVFLEGPDAAYARALLQAKPLAGLAILVLGGSLVGFSVYLWLLREWGAFRAGLYAFISPMIAVAIGVVALGEPFGIFEALGMAVMFGATALAIGPEPEKPVSAS